MKSSMCSKNLQLDSAVEGDPRSRRTGSWLGVEGRWRGGRLGVAIAWGWGGRLGCLTTSL